MQQTENSRKEWEEFLVWEKQKHQDFFLPYYQKNSIEVLQDFGGKGYKSYDVLIKKDGIPLKIDEKARQKNYDDLLVEVFQCLKTGKIGWLYNPINYYFYAMWQDKNSELPESAYMVDAKKLIQFVADNFDKLPSRISEKGYGMTYNKIAKWPDLVFVKVAKKIV